MEHVLNPVSDNVERLIKIYTNNVKVVTVTKKDDLGISYEEKEITDVPLLRRDEELMDRYLLKSYSEYQEYISKFSRNNKRDILIRLDILSIDGDKFQIEYINIRSPKDILEKVYQDFDMNGIPVKEIFIRSVTDITSRFSIKDIIDIFTKYNEYKLTHSNNEVRLYIQKLSKNIADLVMFLEGVITNRQLDNIKSVDKDDESLIEDDNELF
jgi:hypothetical protein